MRIKSINCALLSILVIASIITLAIQLLSSRTVCAALTTHAPIYIDGNAGFTKPDPVNGGGSGTENEPYIIENWNISTGSANGIEIRNTTAVFIIRNCFVHDGGRNYDGIHLENVVNVRTENNIVENNAWGIFLWSSDNSTLNNNTCYNNNCGIFLLSSNNNTLTNNTCYYDLYFNPDSGIIGIDLGLCSNNILTNNTCSNNEEAISIDSSSNNTLTYNTCDNNWDGIRFDGPCYSNTLTNNTCSNNSEYGILVDSESSSNNLIYHNNFINNQYQAIDTGSNYWDNGYPSGGNYWNDHTGSDYCGGENQDMPGSDGIWDTPYYVYGGINLDRYPLRMLNLITGWNLIGFTGVGDNNTPANTFAGLTNLTDYISYYWSAPGGPYTLVGQNEVLKDNVGYWVWINPDKTVSTSGTRPVSENIHLVAGWNLVSFPITNETTTELKIFYNNIPPPMGDYYPIYWWTAPGGPYNLQDPYTAFLNNTGCWVWINQDKTVTVP